MTRAQFAHAAMAGEKWVENAIRLLGRKVRYSRQWARWLALVRVFNQEIGVTLTRAAELADEAVELPEGTGAVTLGRGSSFDAGITIDLARFDSAFAASLSAALTLGDPKKRGRRADSGKRSAVQRAAEYGVDIGLLEAGLKMTVHERLTAADENAQFIVELRRR